MKKLILIGVAVSAMVLGANVASAADPSLPPSWSGFYGGLELGYASTGGQIYDYNNNYAPTAWTDATAGGSFLLGGKMGYDFDTGSNFVVGLSADVKGLLGSDANCSSAGGCDNGAKGQPHLSYGIKGLAALDARAGFLFTPENLLYVEGGLALGDVVTHHRDNSEYDGSSHVMTGWNIGVGIEHKVSQNMSLVLDGKYYNLGEIDVTSVGETYGYKPTAFVASVGFNVRF